MPHYYDERADSLSFVHAPRDVQRRAVFLDPRFLGRARKSPPAPVQELPISLIEANTGPAHFIFHTSFCCSTLLTRAFDVPGVSMGVKEPSVLASFANLLSTPRRPAGVAAAFGATLALLSRPLARGETQIIKPSNPFSYLVPQTLQTRPAAKAILLHSSLEGYLCAVARRNLEGRAFGRSVYQHFVRTIPLDAWQADDDDAVLHTDLEIAAHTWVMQAAFFEAVAKRYGPSRVQLLSDEALLEHPGLVLHGVSRFFDLSLSEADCDAIANGPVFHEHAKNHGAPFGAAEHWSQRRQAIAAHAEEIRGAKAWAGALAERFGAPLALASTLTAGMLDQIA